MMTSSVECQRFHCGGLSRQRPTNYYYGLKKILLLLLCLTVLSLNSIIFCEADNTSTQQQQQQSRKKTLPLDDLLESSVVDDNEIDPALQTMKYTLEDGSQHEVLVYMEPSIQDMYKLYDPPPSTNKVIPQFKGLAGKFINLSNQRVTLYWEEYEGGRRHEMKHQGPFTASGTGTFPGHRFVFSNEGDPTTTLHRFHVGSYPNNIYYYDPYYVENNTEQTEINLQVLTPEERGKYDNWRRTLYFNEQYKQYTGRSYLANYLRQPPVHHMWRGDYFGQEHWVMSRETHFVQLPSEEELQPITTYGTERKLKKDDKRLLYQYRDPTKHLLNLTLTAISVVPRVFRIPNFLSQVEVNHIIQLAAGIDLHLSVTGDGDKPIKDTTNTRTSYNSWVNRQMSPIIDAVYRRAADVLRIDEALLRHRHETGEYSYLSTTKPIGEELQLVHYSHQQEYEAHHDFGYARIDDKRPDGQGARFATLLLYLNDDMVGGETSFPRWVNGETFKQLKITPKAGDAALFYSQLPDGNLDDFSQHAALPIIDGEKWLINLWVWDPIYE